MNGLPYQSVVLATVIFIVNTGAIEYYATKYDHLDVEQILNNRRMVNYYAQCLLSKGPCPPQGLEFKKILPEALETNCLRCTEKQKTVTYRTIKRLKKEYPKIWLELEQKWDPDHIYVTRFEEAFKNPQVPSVPSVPSPSENEINLDDRFGAIETTPTKSTTVKTTTKFIPKKTKKPKYPPSLATKPSSVYIFSTKPTLPPTYTASRPIINQYTTSRPINNIGSASENNHILGLNPFNANVGTTTGNKVGSDDTDTPSTVQIPEDTTQLFTSNVNKNVPTLFTQTENSVETEITTESPKIPNDPQVISAASDVHLNEVSVTPLQVLTNKPQPNLIFDLPLQSPSIFNNNLFNRSPTTQQSNQVFDLPHHLPSIFNNKNTTTTQQPNFDLPHQLPSIFHTQNTTSKIMSKPHTTTRRPLMINRFHNLLSNNNNNNNNRQPDVFSQLINTFLRPPSASSIPPIFSNEKRNSGQPTRSGRPNNDPLRNFVRGIATAGDRLVETGGSIADSVLSSVRTLFTPAGRANRAARRRLIRS